MIILSIPKIKIASANDQITQAKIELMINMIDFMEEIPAIKGMNGLIAGINLPIKIPLQPYLLKKSSPLI